MCRVSGFTCVPRWTIGSMRWTASRSSTSTKKSITGWCRRCAGMCCRGSKPTCRCRPEHQSRMAADPRVPRFTMIFDREGYSPELFLELRKDRIEALTYHRYPEGEAWRAEEFQEQTVKLVSGETVRMKLAERGIHVGKRPGLWVR